MQQLLFNCHMRQLLRIEEYWLPPPCCSHPRKVVTFVKIWCLWRFGFSPISICKREKIWNWQLNNLRKKGNHRREQLQQYHGLTNLMRKDRWKNTCAENKNAINRERILFLFLYQLALSMCCFSLQYLDSFFLNDSWKEGKKTLHF